MSVGKEEIITVHCAQGRRMYSLGRDAGLDQLIAIGLM